MLKNLVRIPQRHTSRQYASAVAAVQPKNNANENRVPLISCKRKQFNIWTPENENSKFGALPLASSGWLHHKSKGDFFVINPTVSEQDIEADMSEMKEFLHSANLNHFKNELIMNLENLMSIRLLTRIQVQAIPMVYDNKHTLIAAETGCGKTLAYLLPIVQKTLQYKEQQNDKERKLNSPLVVIITPGRELAVQIGSVASRLGNNLNLNVKTVLGGNTKRLMTNPEFNEVDVLVATIGALSKLVTTGVYRMDNVRHVVLDEADTLLDDSFTGKLTHFLKRFPFHKNVSAVDSTEGTQLVLASATMPTNTNEILQRVIDIETLNEVVSPNLHKLMPHVEQKFLRLTKSDRPATLLKIVKSELNRKRPLIVFSNKSPTSDYVNIFLNNSGVNCLNLNGDMLMKIRLGRFEQFQNGECNVLSTTDVGSRGLDTTRARHIINYDFPLHISDYIHRCGRIGRIGNLQKSLITNFISSKREVDVVQQIEHTARTGGVLPHVNANIKNIITKRIERDMKAAGIPITNEDEF